MKAACSKLGCGRPAYARTLCQSHYSSAWQKKALPPKQPRPNPGHDFIKAALAADTDQCILWPYAKVTGGYGTFRLNGRSNITAHRFVCEATYGRSKLFAIHRCGVAACVNPRHIRWGTAQENADDRRIHGTNPDGEKAGAALLTAEQVAEIKRRLAQPLKRGDKIAIAREYGVSKSTILDIDAGRSWLSIAA